MHRQGELLILPLAQMSVAAGLLQWSHSLERVGRHFCDMPGDDPAFKILLSVSGPLSVPLTIARFLWFRAGYPWNEIAWIAIAGLFWYWMGIGAVRWREGRGFPLPRGHRTRLVVDTIFVLMALWFALMGVGAANLTADWARLGFREEVICFGPAWSSELLPSLLLTVLYSAWCVVILMVFAGDFGLTLRGRSA